MKNYLAILNEQRKREEETITQYLKGCHIAKIQYHFISFEMLMFMEIEPPFHIPGYKHTGMYNPEPKIAKRHRKLNEKFPPPITLSRIHYYTNTQTGNNVEISETSKKEYWKEEVYGKIRETPYSRLQVKFYSNSKPITSEAINFFLSYVSGSYARYIKIIRDYKDTHPSEVSVGDECLQVLPFYIYFAEPSIDIAGPKESIAFLHQNLVPNCYAKRFTRRESFVKDNDGKKTTRDGRTLSNRNKTDYISRFLRAYPYTQDGELFLRIEFKLDKDFLRNRDIWLLQEYMDNVSPHAIWEEKCIFFMFNLPQIAARIGKKDPKQLDKVMTFLTEKQFKENGEEWTDFEKVLYLRNYKINGKKVFKTYKDYLIPKWLTLHKFISGALKQLSLTTPPSLDVQPEPVEVTEVGDRKTGTQVKISDAVNYLKQEGMANTYSNIMMVSGIKSRATISRHKHLLNGV